MASISCVKLNLNPSKFAVISFGSVRSTATWNRFSVKTPAKKLVSKSVKAMGGSGAPKFKGTQMRDKQLAEMIENKVMEAREACEGDHRGSDECKVAWDEVEEVSQAKADLRLKLEREEDPLESFCHHNPETEECIVYDD